MDLDHVSAGRAARVAVKALGVDLEQDVYGVAGALGDIGCGGPGAKSPVAASE